MRMELMSPSRRDVLRFGGASAALTVAGRASAMPADPWLHAAQIVRTVKAPQFPARTFDITKYGAKGDGLALNSDAIAKAVAACAAAGGGRCRGAGRSVN